MSYTTDHVEYTLEIGLKDVIRGEKAENMLKKANKYNDPPKEGMEYIIGIFEFKLSGGNSDNPVKFNKYTFDAVSRSGSVYDDTFVSSMTDSISLYTGGTADLYVIDTIQKEDLPMWVFKKIWVDATLPE
jgi:hypothetical protein